jgi:hypothetical protein
VKRRFPVGLGRCGLWIFCPCVERGVFGILRDGGCTTSSAVYPDGMNFSAYQVYHLLLEGGRVPFFISLARHSSYICTHRGVSICLLLLSSLLCFLASLHTFNERVSTTPSRSRIRPDRAKTTDTSRMAYAFRR